MKPSGASPRTRWRSTAAEALRPVRRFFRRGAKVVWWTVTLQLPRRLRMRRARAIVEARSTGVATSVHDEVHRFSAPGPDFETFAPARGPVRARVIAFYLPQFHVTPENDAFWGQGFTEWRNVARGLPRFSGHYQPRIPGELGYYDLADPAILRQQVQMARAAGIAGFAFYYYRFSSGRVLGLPVEQLLADPSLDMPFLLVWANENWTRTWDGLDREILLEQTYDQALEDALIADFARHFADPRYLRIEGRPLLMIYRPTRIPHVRDRVERWRSRFSAEHGEHPLFLMPQSDEAADPRAFGLDGAVEFPPHVIGRDTGMEKGLTLLDPEFVGQVRDYRRMAADARRERSPGYPLIRTVTPSWDNEARRPGRGLTYTGSSPSVFRAWLDEAIDFATRHPFRGESLVFVNAWNEWAEGAYLEPDMHFGAAYLNATSRAIHGVPEPGGRRRILLVGHDAQRNGAQLLLLHIGRIFTRRFGIDVSFLLLGDGDLMEDYRSVAPVTVIPAGSAGIEAYLAGLRERGFDRAITNTVVSGAVVPALRDAGFSVVSLVHEMPGIIRDRGWEAPARQIATASDVVIIPSQVAAAGFGDLFPGAAARMAIRPQGLYQALVPADEVITIRRAVRARLGWGATTTVVLGVGFGDRRKGIDLFLEAAAISQRRRADMRFVWVGEIEGGRQGRSVPDSFVHIPFTNGVGEWYAGADVFFMASREDPYPSTMLEAAASGLPIVTFAGRVGSEHLAAEYGTVVSDLDAEAAFAALEGFPPAPDEERLRRTLARRAEVTATHRFDDYGFDLLRRFEPNLPKVSVVVPNFEYARYLGERLGSIFDQTHPVFEVVVLDDASTDDSLDVVARISGTRGRDVTVLTNAANSGSVIGQWRRGVTATTGDLVWIAEADDRAAPEFLATAIRSMGPETVLAFTDSRVIDARGTETAASYRGYYAGVAGGEHLLADLEIDGAEFARTLLAIENVVLNVSATVTRRADLVDVLTEEAEALRTYRFAGDWHVYLHLMPRGRVSFVARSLSTHRRHRRGATLGSGAAEHIAEIALVHDEFNRMFPAPDPVRSAQADYRMRVAARLQGDGA